MVAVSLTAEQLLDALKMKAPELAEATRLHAVAKADIDLAFERAWRVVPVPIADDCLIKVAQAHRDGKRATNAGKQLATVEGGVATRAPLDPLDPIRSTLARYVVPL